MAILDFIWSKDTTLLQDHLRNIWFVVSMVICIGGSKEDWHLLKSLPHTCITVRFKGLLVTFWCPSKILRYVANLLVRVRAYASDVIGRRFEKSKNNNTHLYIWEFEKKHRFENWTPIWAFDKKDIDLRYRCLWCKNLTWIWGLDVD
jgi:uncharacterized membrane protein